MGFILHGPGLDGFTAFEAISGTKSLSIAKLFGCLYQSTGYTVLKKTSVRHQSNIPEQAQNKLKKII